MAATLFVGAGRSTPLAARLQMMASRRYASAVDALKPPRQRSLLIDPRRVTLGFRQRVPDAVRVIEAINYSVQSRKTDHEAQFVRQAMERGCGDMRSTPVEQALAADERITELTIDDG